MSLLALQLMGVEHAVHCNALPMSLAALQLDDFVPLLNRHQLLSQSHTHSEIGASNFFQDMQSKSCAFCRKSWHREQDVKFYA